MKQRILQAYGLRRSPAACLFISTVIAGCAGPPSDAAVTVRDSAGIQIIEHPQDINELTEVWRVAVEPRITVGVVAGDSQDLLFNVEGAHVLDDGRVIVANRGTNELRYYDDAGEYLFSGGREGEGPGEFKYIAWTARCGNHVYTYDIATRRMAVYDEDGQHQRDFRVVAPNGRPPYGMGSCRQNGTFLAMGWYLRDGAPQLGVYRESHPVFLMDSIGTILHSYGDFPGPDRWGHERGSSPLPLGRSTVHVLGPHLAYLGTGDTYEILGLDSVGAVRRIIRKTMSDPQLTAEDIATYESKQLAEARNENDRRGLRRRFDEMEYPETVPAYERFLMDSAGHLWVADFVRPADEVVRWSVFDTNGKQVATAETQGSFNVLEVGQDYVLGVTRDELDVEYVQVLRLDRR